MDNNLEKAKALFIGYGCNIHNIWRDGAGEKYATYCVSDAQEQAWRGEYISQIVSRLSVDDLSALIELSSARAFEALPALMDFAQQGDSYSRLRYAILISELMDYRGVSRRILKQAESIHQKILQSLIQGSIELTQAHRDIIWLDSTMQRDATPEEVVREMARRHLREREKYLREARQYDRILRETPDVFKGIRLLIDAIQSLFRGKRLR